MCLVLAVVKFRVSLKILEEEFGSLLKYENAYLYVGSQLFLCNEKGHSEMVRASSPIYNR